jgi:hypothetical protein
MQDEAMELAAADPKGLVREAYAIEGITPSECRSIFLDWALSLAPGIEPHAAMRRLLSAYAAANEDHPMTAVIRDGLAAPEHPVRKGGRAARVGRQ